MRFVSTAGRSAAASLPDALFAGPAPDRGLYVPERLPPLPPERLERLRELDLGAISLEIARHLLGADLPEADLERIVSTSLDFPVPLVEVEEGIWCLELFHGPTLAFKDVGARFMARLMSYYLAAGRGPAGAADLTILVATSGDTGSAVASAFAGLDGIRVEVLFPRGQVSLAQQKLFTTVGGNVGAVSIEGTFDDCQRLAKEAFADRSLRRERPLASANSINVGRLLPQIFYYFHARARLPRGDTAPWIATPSGNFGNLTAGLMAKRLGLDAHRFVAATNVNDVVPRYLDSGVFRPRSARQTIANAMDVGNPSNVERLLHLYGDDLGALRRDLVGSRFRDREIEAAIGAVFRRTGYLLDPHSAIGCLGLLEHRAAAGDRRAGIFLGTAHPAKFADVVGAATGEPVPLPPVLRAALERPEHVVELSADYGELRRHLLRS